MTMTRIEAILGRLDYRAAYLRAEGRTAEFHAVCDRMDVLGGRDSRDDRDDDGTEID
jgi:hypothetical protein